MQTDRRVLVVRGHVSKSPKRQQDALLPWLPWIMAPVFALLPIVGCWLANLYQQPRDMILRHPTVATSLPSTETVVTVALPNEQF